MASEHPRAGTATPGATAAGEVEAFLTSLDHPFEREIHAVRRVILGADPRIAEGIKWNAPSFRTSEYFATLHLRAKDGVRVILHFGAKKRESPTSRDAIPDPDALLQWLGPDRASATFRDLADVEARGAAFASVVRHWIEHV